MYKFEDIMRDISNYRAYCYLVDAIEKQDLICYVGAGLSLYSKRWGEPFEKIVEKLCYFSNLENREIGDLGKYTSQLQEIKSDLKQQSVNYLRIGDEIDCIIRESHMRIVNKIKDDTFNDWFSDVIKNCAGITVSDFHKTTSPYAFLSICYLPYLGPDIRFLTTNCDSSFDFIWELNAKNISSYYKGKSGFPAEWFNSNTRGNKVFYLHGHMDVPDSLVMTQKAYSETYGVSTGNHPAKDILTSAIREKSILFLGASLINDQTVQLINEENLVDEHIGQLANNIKYIPIFKDRNDAESSGLKMQDPIVVGDYGSISVVLHQLIRETSTSWEHCSWNQKLEQYNTRYCSQNISDEIEDSLKKRKRYDVLNFKQEQYDEVLSCLYTNYLYSNGPNGTPSWTLCQITDDNFSLKIKKHISLHNYPLGNTVYIIGGPNMHKDSCKRIVDEIRSWRCTDYPRYSFNSEKRDPYNDTGDEKFSAPNQRDGKFFEANLKVRIILFDSPPSTTELLDDANDKIKELKRGLHVAQNKISELEAENEKLRNNNAERNAVINDSISNLRSEFERLLQELFVAQADITSLTNEAFRSKKDSLSIIRFLCGELVKKLKTQNQNEFDIQLTVDNKFVLRLTLKQGTETTGGGQI